jgi:hypothetical protein
MGGTVRKLTGEDEKRKAEEAARKAEADRVKMANERNEQMRSAGESQASSRRARRRGGLLETASVIGGEQTLGSGTNL